LAVIAVLDGAGDVTVGYDAESHVTVSESTAVGSRNTNIGYNAGSLGELIVSGPGTTWRSAQDLRVAYRSTGTMRVMDGAEVATGGNSYIGKSVFSVLGGPGDGSVIVTGGGSAWTTEGALHVGLYPEHLGTGVLEIADGGSVTAGTTYIKHLLRLDNGSLVTAHSTTMGRSKAREQSRAILARTGA
jgi:fibronectin-binding autotransporter adhesin